MRKFSISLLVVGSLISSSAALADNHTVSAGYAQSKIEHLYNMKGFNLQYRYETDFPVGVLVSATYLSGDKEEWAGSGWDYQYAKLDTKSYSLQTGPVYRFNSLASIYGTVGFSYNKVKAYYEDRWLWAEASENKTEFAYGAGVIINPINNLSINVGYEGSRLTLLDEHVRFNGFNIGIGYRF